MRAPVIYRRLILLGLLAGVIPLFSMAADGDPLPAEVMAELRRYGLSPRHLSVYVQVVDQDKPLVAYQADVPRNPASSIKVLTTLAALEILGPGYTWKTEVWSRSPIRDGRLDGDLYLKGYGDPFLVIEHFWRFLRELRNDGLVDIRGHLVLDQSYFAQEPGDPAVFDGKPHRAYNVLPRALMVNFQAVRFHLQPQPELNRVRIVADPHLAGLEVVNRIQLRPGRCRDGARRVALQVLPGQAMDKMVFSGRMDGACGEAEFFRVVAEPVRHTHGVFTALWRELGGRFDGDVREGRVPEDARLLHRMSSPMLGDIVRSINKHSNNLMTRMLLLTLGTEGDTPGTTARGIARVRQWLTQSGMNFPELVLDNGAGLSREERISARHLGEVMLAGYRSPFMPEFMSSLPVSGEDGTMQRRHAGTALEGRTHLKTGTINSVRAMAGYLQDRRGRRVVVVSLHNDPRVNSLAGERVQDAILRWAYERP
ncbi:MAG: D-alanyl-D-alanine carboxypeptidase/D-alanyl-D-alanine-endopeptidase [Pseudomonadota bacterium]